MYCEHFGFKERPFTIAPNPKFLFMSELHREALAHLVFGIGDSGGFVLLTGEVGTGKTTVCRCLLEQLPDNTDIAFILNPRLSALELLESICDDLELTFMQDDVSLKNLNDVLNAHLLRAHAKGRQTILLIDEAQNLDIEVLEQIRLLTNLETNETKLLQIILIGQPELKDILDKVELRQLSQRITARYHLAPLSLQETMGYIQYRMAVAGCNRALFSESAIGVIQHISQGVPRLINTICDRALLGAYAKGLMQVDVVLIKQAAVEVLGSKGRASSAKVHTTSGNSSFIKQAVSAVVLLVVGIFLGGFFSSTEDHKAFKIVQKQVSSPKQNTHNPLSQDFSEPDRPVENNPLFLKSGMTLQSLLVFTTNYDEAFARLTEIWLEKSLSGCQQLTLYNMSCEHLQGDWRQMLSMDRPAIITLAIEGQTLFLTVVGMDDNRMAVIRDSNLAWVEKSLLEKVWTGEYLLLWKSPKNFIRPIKIGDSGPLVQWLEKKLLLITQPQLAKNSIVPETLVFDRNIEVQLQSFQQQYGLNADGVVGLRTIMLINQLTEPNLPRLEKLSNFLEAADVTHP